ncbi:MAG: TIGR03000 domain-containing protein [Gemmataceae bacterium]|nr:TIGR03000 domain-containing protein [Gemmataceae bacterium]
MKPAAALVLLLLLTPAAPAQFGAHPTSLGFPGVAGQRPVAGGRTHWPWPVYPIWYGQVGVPYYYWEDPSVSQSNIPPKTDSLIQERPTGGSPPPAAPRVQEFVPAPAPGTARITLEVPPEATVTCQGQPTQQTGAVRVFNTPVMTGPGEYTFVVSWKDGDRVREQTLTVPVSAGSTPTVRVVK